MRKKKKSALFRYSLGVLISIVFVFAVFLGIKTVLSAKWDGHRRFTVVADGDPLLLFSIEPDSKKAVLLIIPANVILDVPFGYSTYPAGAVYQLGSLDSKRGGGKLLSKSIENSLGVVTEGYIAKSKGSKFIYPTEPEKLFDLKKTYFSLTGLISSVFKFHSQSKNIVTNLSVLDIFRLWKSIKNLRSDQITVLNLGDSNALIEEKLPDGITVASINQELFDKLISSKFQDQKVRLQNVSVEIINATDRERVASQFGRILQNLGANVVVKSTAVNPEPGNCILKISKKELRSSIIVQRLKKFYNCSEGSENNIGVADMKIILGSEFIK